jgi:voltage-gated potassium channel Kch
MGAHLRLLLQRPLLVVGVVLGLTAVKLLVMYAVARVARHGRGSAVSLAIALSQGGEFAFVVLGAAQAAQVIPAEVGDLLIVVVSLSMVLTPVLFIIRDRWLKRAAARAPQRPYDEIAGEEVRVIIAGFGRFGQIVARLLRTKHIPFTALEANMTQVDFVRRFGNKIYYGDASRVDLLRAAKADKADLFVLAVDDPEASVRIAEAVQQNFPKLRIVARARNRQHAYALMALGIDHVVRELFFSSLNAARQVLEDLGLTTSEAREAARRFLEYDEAMLVEQFKVRDDEQALIATAKKSAQDLEKLFEQDAKARP